MASPSVRQESDLTMPGYLEYQAREAFLDLCRVYGFEQARAIIAEIINSEANGRRH